MINVLQMEVIFLLGAVQALFLAVLVFNKKKKSAGDFVLGAWLAFMGIHLLHHYLYSTGFMFRHPHLLGTGIAFSLLEGPFMFIYVLVMISKTGKFRWVYLLHGLPFMLFSIYFTFEFYVLSADEKLSYFEQMYTKMPRDLYIISLPMIFFGPIYLVWSLVKLKRHSRNISEQFSYHEQINLRWLRNVLIFVGFVWFTVIIANIFVKFPFLSVDMHEHVQYLALTLAVFFIGFYGIRQQAIYRQEQEIHSTKVRRPDKTVKKEENRYKHSGLKKDDAEKHAAKLRSYFTREQPYLEGKLRLNDVAAHLDITTNHLSQVINEEIGMSFFDFVNRYRVEEFKSRLADNQDQFTLLGIAYDCGFNSKSSFNSNTRSSKIYKLLVIFLLDVQNYREGSCPVRLVDRYGPVLFLCMHEYKENQDYHYNCCCSHCFCSNSFSTLLSYI